MQHKTLIKPHFTNQSVIKVPQIKNSVEKFKISHWQAERTICVYITGPWQITSPGKQEEVPMLCESCGKISLTIT